MAKALSIILEEVVQKDVQWKIDVLQNWASIVGTIALHSRVEKISQDTIIVGVYDACWLHELHMLSQDLLCSINAYLKQHKIVHIRFKQVARHKKTDRSSLLKSSIVERKCLKLGNKQQEALRELVDRDLAEALQKVWYHCVKEKD